MDKELIKLTKKYWSGTDSQYAIAQEMKKKGLCKHDMDCYRKLLQGVEKVYRN